MTRKEALRALEVLGLEMDLHAQRRTPIDPELLKAWAALIREAILVIAKRK